MKKYKLYYFFNCCITIQKRNNKTKKIQTKLNSFDVLDVPISFARELYMNFLFTILIVKHYSMTQKIKQ